MLEQWLFDDLTETWAFLLSMANGILGLPPSEFLSFKAAQVQATYKMVILLMVLVTGSIVAGLLMFLFGRSFATFPWVKHVASRVIKLEKWPILSEDEYFKAIFLGRLTPGIRSQVPIVAGFLGGRFKIFWQAHLLGTIVWYCFWVSLSKIFLLLTVNSKYQTIHVVGLLVTSVVVIHAVWYFLPILRKIYSIIRTKKN